MNNAGLMPHSKFIKGRVEDWNRMIDHVTDKEQKAAMAAFYHQFSVNPDRIAQAIAFAVNTPQDTGMDEIVILPSG